MTSNTIFLINFRNHRDMYPPFGIMYVADALEQIGFSVKIFHETEEFVEPFVKQVETERPLFVGFSTITGPQLRPTIEASKKIALTPPQLGSVETVDQVFPESRLWK